MSDELLMIGVSPVAQANVLKAKLAERGVTIEYVHNAQTCSTGCAMTVEIWARKPDMPAIAAVFEEERQRLFAGLEFDPQVVNQVFDTSKEEAVCPACGTSFSTSLRECPDCGLAFQLPEGEA